MTSKRTDTETSDWVLVPREPTPEMLEAGKAERIMTNSTVRVYQVMIANAPQPLSASPKGDEHDT